MAYKIGTMLSSNVTEAATSAGVGQAPDQRRLYDFSDRLQNYHLKNHHFLYTFLR